MGLYCSVIKPKTEKNLKVNPSLFHLYFKHWKQLKNLKYINIQGQRSRNKILKNFLRLKQWHSRLSFHSSPSCCTFDPALCLWLTWESSWRLSESLGPCTCVGNLPRSSSRLPALDQPSSRHCSYSGSSPADRKSPSFPLPVILPFK